MLEVEGCSRLTPHPPTCSLNTFCFVAWERERSSFRRSVRLPLRPSLLSSTRLSPVPYRSRASWPTKVSRHHASILPPRPRPHRCCATAEAPRQLWRARVRSSTRGARRIVILCLRRAAAPPVMISVASPAPLTSCSPSDARWIRRPLFFPSSSHIMNEGAVVNERTNVRRRRRRKPWRLPRRHDIRSFFPCFVAPSLASIVRDFVLPPSILFPSSFLPSFLSYNVDCGPSLRRDRGRKEGGSALRTCHVPSAVGKEKRKRDRLTDWRTDGRPESEKRACSDVHRPSTHSSFDPSERTTDRPTELRPPDRPSPSSPLLPPSHSLCSQRRQSRSSLLWRRKRRRRRRRTTTMVPRWQLPVRPSFLPLPVRTDGRTDGLSSIFLSSSLFPIWTHSVSGASSACGTCLFSSRSFVSLPKLAAADAECALDWI